MRGDETFYYIQLYYKVSEIDKITLFATEKLVKSTPGERSPIRPSPPQVLELWSLVAALATATGTLPTE